MRTKLSWALWALLVPALWAQGKAEPRSLDSMYPDVSALRQATHDLVLLVDTEHPDNVRKNLRDRAPRYHSLERVRLCIELETAGLPCLLVHASLLTPQDVVRQCVKAVVLCGRNKRTSAEEDKRLHRLLKECRAPLLAISGGMGIMTEAYGGEVGSLRRLKPGEPDPDSSSSPGVFKEVGFTKVRVVQPDPIFKSLAGAVEVMERHSSQVKALPPDFDLLASTDECRVQACRHRGRPIYGLQFLAYQFDDFHTDGRQVLRNFFALAGIDTERRIPEARTAFRGKTRTLVRNVCQEPRVLSKEKVPFVVLVNMEGPDVVASTQRGSGTGLTHAEKMERFRKRIEGELTGLPCVVVHYIEVREEDFASLHLRAIVLSGAGSPSVDAMTRDLYAVIRKARVPIMGICAGHQHVAKAHGAESVPMRPLRKGEKDPNPAYHPGMFKEWGFLPVKILKRDPLFEGLPDTIVVQQYHMGNVKSLPEGFELLASTEECQVQAFKRLGRAVYGTQFHSECYDDEHLDGRRVLQNFFRIAAKSQ
jgi:GMP synthase (glutamine-hydrolysing)